MIRTIVVAAALIVAVLFLPVWIQLVLFFVAIWVTPYRFALLAPAVLADVIYNPAGSFSIFALKYTVVVAGIIVIRWLLVTQTRFGSLVYGMEI